jgi:DNA-binding response OmpR family regulator
MAEQKKIVIAEDDEFLSSLIKNRLESENFAVKTAKSGEEAVTIINEFKPDLVLLDIILPGKLGFDVLKETRSNNQLNKTAFMILSNLGQESDIKKAKDLGVIEYFVKAQVVIENVVEKIIKFLNNEVEKIEEKVN